MTIYTDRSDSTIDRAIRAAFPGYKGRKVQLIARSEIELDGLYWDGGSRSQYTLIDLDTFRTGSPPAAACNPPQFGGPASAPKVTIPVNGAILEHSTFRGKDMGIRFYAHPERLAPLLPASVELTVVEGYVLTTSRNLKSSYGGKDRFDNSGYERSRSDSDTVRDLTREGWEEAKAGLIARGLLRKNGAITNEGRNAIPEKVYG